MPEPKTPMMKQYHAAKAAHPEALLFFRMGDFYELFYEDAVTASRALGLTLTSRSKGEDAVPMAGVPYHAADRYIRELIRAGHRVAVCDQTVDPSTVKGLVPREVTRVVTPGTLVEEGALEATANNYLAAACVWRDAGGLAYADLSTGEVHVETVPAQGLAEAVERVGPAECLVPEDTAGDEDGPLAALGRGVGGVLTPRPESDFSRANAPGVVREHYGVAALDGFGLADTDPAVGATAAVLRYLSATQRGRVAHLRPPRKVDAQGTLVLDRATVRNLELVETILGRDRRATLYGIINRTCTGPGARLLRRWMLRPLADLDALRARQAAVAELMADRARRGRVRELLADAADVDRIMGRVGCGRANARDLAALGRTLGRLPAVVDALQGTESDELTALQAPLCGLEDLAERLSATLVEDPPAGVTEGGLVRKGVHAELDELRDLRANGRQWIAEFQAAEIERTGIPSLKVGFNKVFGYYIEVTKTHLARVPEAYERKQTLVNAERFITPQLKEHEEKILGAQERIARIEYDVFVELREAAAARFGPVQAAADALARLDACQGLAETGDALGYVMPRVDEGRAVRIAEGRHPVLETMLPAGKFVPNDLEMDPNASRILIVTGPNMSGKSTYIRQCALLVVLAQMGAPVPAREAHIGLADRIFTRVGAADELARGQSTFMVEMSEAANILNNATERSFIVLDEVGRGTSTYDGVSLAWALTEYIHGRVGARCVFATHYHELAELGVLLPAAANCNVAVRDWGGEVIFLHRIQPGSADRSYGIHVAKIAGVPRPVIERARTILEGLELQARERQGSLVEEGAALRAAAREVQTGLFDDPDRDRLCADLARLDPEALGGDEALALLRALHERARRCRGAS